MGRPAAHQPLTNGAFSFARDVSLEKTQQTWKCAPQRSHSSAHQASCGVAVEAICCLVVGTLDDVARA
jgi:hypothetical protein